jgi:hypothetical protein
MSSIGFQLPIDVPFSFPRNGSPRSIEAIAPAESGLPQVRALLAWSKELRDRKFPAELPILDGGSIESDARESALKPSAHDDVIRRIRRTQEHLSNAGLNGFCAEAGECLSGLRRALIDTQRVLAKLNKAFNAADEYEMVAAPTEPFLPATWVDRFVFMSLLGLAGFCLYQGYSAIAFISEEAAFLPDGKNWVVCTISASAVGALTAIGLTLKTLARKRLFIRIIGGAAVLSLLVCIGALAYFGIPAIQPDDYGDAPDPEFRKKLAFFLLYSQLIGEILGSAAALDGALYVHARHARHTPVESRERRAIRPTLERAEATRIELEKAIGALSGRISAAIGLINVACDTVQRRAETRIRKIRSDAFIEQMLEPPSGQTAKEML